MTFFLIFNIVPYICVKLILMLSFIMWTVQNKYWIGLDCVCYYLCTVMCYICMLLFSPVLHCNTYVCYNFVTVMCYNAIHMYVTINIQSCVELKYTCVLTFLYNNVLHCNTYVCYYYVTVICYNAIHMYVTIYVLDMYVNI